MTLLLDEPPVVVQPSLVRKVGLLEAAITQQLHYWLERATCVHDGERWVYKTYQEWSTEIGVSAKAARGSLDRLRRDGYVIAIQNPTDSHDRTLWWRIDYSKFEADPSAPEGSPPAPEGAPPAPAGSSSRASRSGTKTTSETTAERECASTNEFPEDLPEAMHETAIAVGKILKRTALARGQRREVTRGAVGLAIVSFPDRPHLQVARDVEHWLLHGRGAQQSCADIVARYRNFLKTSEPAAGPPLPAGVTPLHGRRMSNMETVDAQIRALRGNE